MLLKEEVGFNENLHAETFVALTEFPKFCFRLARDSDLRVKAGAGAAKRPDTFISM